MSKRIRMRTAENNKVETLSVFNTSEIPKANGLVNEELSKKEKTLINNILGVDIDKPKEEKKKLKYLYQIYDPEKESEYYTSSELIISGMILQARSIIQKKMLEETVVNQTIQVFYSFVSDEFKFVEFNLSKGVIIKTFTEELLEDWLSVNEQTAKDILKEKTLQAYKNLMPALINKIGSLENQVQQQSKIKRRSTEEDYGSDLLHL